MYSIALIEDSPSDVMLLRMALDKAGVEYELDEISDGRSVVQSLHDRIAPPDLIITDFVVPGMDCERLLAELQSVPRLRDVPVIVMSGMRNSDLTERLKGQVADHIVKPANLAGWREIGERVRYWLERAKGAEGGA